MIKAWVRIDKAIEFMRCVYRSGAPHETVLSRTVDKAIEGLGWKIEKALPPHLSELIYVYNNLVGALISFITLRWTWVPNNLRMMWICLGRAIRCSRRQHKWGNWLDPTRFTIFPETPPRPELHERRKCEHCETIEWR